MAYTCTEYSFYFLLSMQGHLLGGVRKAFEFQLLISGVRSSVINTEYNCLSTHISSVVHSIDMSYVSSDTACVLSFRASLEAAVRVPPTPSACWATSTPCLGAASSTAGPSSGLSSDTLKTMRWCSPVPLLLGTGLVSVLYCESIFRHHKSVSNVLLQYMLR